MRPIFLSENVGVSLHLSSVLLLYLDVYPFFWHQEWLTEGTADLTGLNYAVFGLGNKTYEHFNAMGKYVDKRLEELGATRVYDLGLGE